MAFVSENAIREVRERTDLVELIGGSVALKRSGRGFVGLCPFHAEKTPSFHVNPERGIYHCFGCGVTGDALRFVMEHDHLSFPEALDELARRAGVELELDPAHRSAERGEHERLVAAHEIAARLYRETLESKDGDAARAEIARRKISPDTVREYRLGAAAPLWDRLVVRARRDGISAEVLERAGLAVKRESGSGHYDRFRDRLMFPIEIMGPRVVAFGGRVLGEGDPKYLNSPETPLFRKRKTLYGLPQASASLRATREAILVEGYMDVLALASAGFGNAIGALGTAFTAEHAQALARIVDRVIVVFDGDAAGMKAMLASAGPLIGAGLEVRVVSMPEGEDPDSFVRERGAESFREAMVKSSGVVDALLGEEAYESAAGRDRALRRALGALVDLEDVLRRRTHLQEIADRTRIPVELLEERAARMRDRDPERQAPLPAAPVTSAARPNALDRTFLAIMLHHESLAAELLGRCTPADLEDPVVSRIVARMTEDASRGAVPSAATLLEELREDGEAASLLGEIAVTGAFLVEPERIAHDCTQGFRRRTMQKETADLDREIRKAKARGDDQRVDELTGELLRLRIRIEALHKESVPGER